MEQLLKIKTTPIKISVQVEQGKYVDRPKVSSKARILKKPPIQRTRVDSFKVVGKHNVQQSPALNRLNGGGIDTSGLRKMAIQQGMQQVNDVIMEKINAQVMPHVVHINDGNKPSIEPSSLHLEFQPIKMDFDFSKMKQSLTYQPANLKFVIDEYPDIDIEYVGDPIYVPRSADPDYEGEEE